jgi:DNA-binding transcriptional LysR family regulator
MARIGLAGVDRSGFNQAGDFEVLRETLAVPIGDSVAQHGSRLTQILVRDKRTLPNNHTAVPYDCFVLDLNRLRILRAVVASGSVNETARRLGYTPSTVSQHVHTLEREVGFPLVERVGRGIVPTAAAVELALASVDVLHAMSKLEARTRDLREGAADRLALRSFASAAYSWVPTIARALRHEFPGLTLELSINETDNAEEAGQSDIEIHTELPYAAQISAAGYRRTELGTDEFLLALPSDHPLVGSGPIDLAEFAEDDWVQYDFRDDVATGLAARACAEAGFTPRYVARAQDHVTGLAFVAAGVGITLIPELAAAWSAFDVDFVRTQNPTPYRKIVVLVRNAAAANPATSRILELLIELAGGSRPSPPD